MKHRLAVIILLASIFILGTLIAKVYSPKHAEKKDVASAVTKESAEPEADIYEEETPGEALEMTAEEEETQQEIVPEPEPEIEPLPKYRDLLEINPYVAGWLCIDGSPIDCPVVYTPGSQNYFLHRAIDGSNESKGTLFIAVNWREGFHNTLIYGHNMKDGSGFGSLAKFADKNYGLSHPVIHFDTLTEEREYELFAAFYSQIEEEELETEEDREAADQVIEEKTVAEIEEQTGEPVVVEELTIKDMDLHRDFGDADIYRVEKDEDNGRFRYYYYTDLADRDDFEYYVRNVKERALYDTGVEPEWGDDLVTLSTCSYHVNNGRFVLVGVRKR